MTGTPPPGAPGPRDASGARKAPWRAPVTVGSAAYRAARERRTGDLVRVRATPAGVFALAREMFLAGTRLDMQALAARAGVSRATLYRWTGQREQLLADVIWSLTEDIWNASVRRSAHLSGTERIMAAVRRFLGFVADDSALRAFLRQETHAALRVLTGRDAGVQGRMVDAVAALLSTEAATGAFVPRAEIEPLAFAMVRATEGFLYNDAVAAVEPDVETALSVLYLLIT
ncbi:QsdR family transcriptional regulator [Streptomyces sp. 8N616]|uniref:QsdR family transcriptional regulator n=1 Tax=Streptomyces sp. 8N616 TaxID=3457414 RepID=UPI003FD241AE